MVLVRNIPRLGIIGTFYCTKTGKHNSIVPFPKSFRETLAMYITSTAENKTLYLFESSWKNHILIEVLEEYSNLAGMRQNISPHKLRHFLFTWLKKEE